jgi:Fe-S cluster biosynthesis and repair protein YggX
MGGFGLLWWWNGWLEKLVMVVKENRHVRREKRERKMDFVIFCDFFVGK